MLTVFQASSSCCVGPGGSAAAISTHQHPEPLGAARADDAELGARARSDEAYARRAQVTYPMCALLRGSAQARAALQERRLEWPATMTQQGAAMQNYNNELVKCERPRGGACRAGGEGVGLAGLQAQAVGGPQHTAKFVVLWLRGGPGPDCAEAVRSCPAHNV